MLMRLGAPFEIIDFLIIDCVTTSHQPGPGRVALRSGGSCQPQMALVGPVCFLYIDYANIAAVLLPASFIWSKLIQYLFVSTNRNSFHSIHVFRKNHYTSVAGLTFHETR